MVSPDIEVSQPGEFADGGRQHGQLIGGYVQLGQLGQVAEVRRQPRQTVVRQQQHLQTDQLADSWRKPLQLVSTAKSIKSCLECCLSDELTKNIIPEVKVDEGTQVLDVVRHRAQHIVVQVESL